MIPAWAPRVLPGPGLGLLALGAGLGWGLLMAGSVAALRRRGWAVAYTRKVFHFGIFTGAALVHGLAGLPATNVYGAAVALLVVVAVLRGDGDDFYEALARPADRPRRSLFIVVPLVTTAVGGLASALLAGAMATVGYLVAGWGDAVGEPVGARWGRHRYRVPSLGGVPAERSWEGSAAVFGVSWLAAVLALLGLGVAGGTALGVSAAVALVSAGVEAWSPHGADNLTVQLAAALTAALLLRG